MRILFITSLFQPEPNLLKGLKFIKELQKNGYSVEVLTGFPNYPTGKIYPGYRQKLIQKQDMEGVAVTRIPSYLSHDRSSFRRILNYLSFALIASFWGIFRVKRPELVYIYQGPATLALPALIMKIFWKIPFILDVQDLWPESVLSSGMMRSGIAEKILHIWSDLTYRQARHIIVLSPGYKRRISSRNIESEKISVVYNWSSDGDIDDIKSGNAYESFFDSDKFNIVYAGNIGVLQALENVIHAAASLEKERPDIVFNFIGDGVEAEKLKELVIKMGIRNVKFFPRQDSKKVKYFLAQADVLLIHLKNENLCSVGIPQKVQAYLAAGRPILIAAEGDAAGLVKKAGAGIICDPENSKKIKEKIKYLENLTEIEIHELGKNGRIFYKKEMTFSVGVKKIVNIIGSV